MKIAGREVGLEHKPFVVAEIAQTHDGSLGNALAFIDLAKNSGASAVKFQTHIASEESTPSEPWRKKFSYQDATRFDFWVRTGFSFQQWKQLKAHADAQEILFLSSPFSLQACQWLEEIGVPAWKLASGEVHNRQLIDWIVATRKPIIISSGLSSIAETKSVARNLINRGVEISILHCTTKYPTPPEDAGLNVFEELALSFSVPTGISDHSGTIFPAIAATYLGASIIEVHLTMHRGMFGADVSSSLTPDQLSMLVEGVNYTWRMRQNKVDKDEQLAVLTNERSIFGRSLVAAHKIVEGAQIRETDLAYKKPGGGMAYEERDRLLGRIAVKDIEKDQMLAVSDIV